MILGGLLLLLLAAAGIYFMVFGNFSRWLVRSFVVLVVIGTLVASISLPTLGSQWVTILVLGPVLATKTFWRCLGWSVKVLAQHGAEKRKAAEEVRRSSRSAVSAPELGGDEPRRSIPTTSNPSALVE